MDKAKEISEKVEAGNQGNGDNIEALMSDGSTVTGQGLSSVKPPVTKAVILVGGWGTRLRPLTYTVPKPLVSFCNRPILEYQVEKLVKAGIKEIVLALNYYSDKIKKEVMKYETLYGVKIIYSKEDEPLGTAGPLALARKHLEGSSFFVLNSDIACNADLSLMMDEYMKGEALGSILIYGVEDPTRYGLIKVDGKKIRSFLEKPKKMEGAGPWLINAGIYVLSHRVLDYIELREMSIEKEVFPVLAEEGHLEAFKLDGYWMDIGQPVDYLRGQRLAVENMDIDDAILTDSIEGGNWAGGVPNCGYINRRDNVVVGQNVKIGNNVKLRDCALFDHSIVEDNVTVENSIVGWGTHLKSDCKVLEFTVLGTGSVVERDVELRGYRSKPNELVRN